MSNSKVASPSQKVKIPAPLNQARAESALALIRDQLAHCGAPGRSVLELIELQNAAREARLFTKRELESAVDLLVGQGRIALEVDPEDPGIIVRLVGGAQ